MRKHKLEMGRRFGYLLNNMCSQYAVYSVRLGGAVKRNIAGYIRCTLNIRRGLSARRLNPRPAYVRQCGDDCGHVHIAQAMAFCGSGFVDVNYLDVSLTSSVCVLVLVLWFCCGLLRNDLPLF